MKITILTLFPEIFKGPFDVSIIKNAQDKKLIEINIINIRDYGIGKHKVVDDTPYGGGIGMILRVDVLAQALKDVTKTKSDKQKIILLSASGKKYDQQKAIEYSTLNHLILICGHYEGVDERIKKYLDDEISIGDYVLTGGEIPAMIITDSVTRLISGVLKPGATDNESFSLKGEDHEKYLEYPHYTKPAVFEDMSVPEILLSGNHKKINEWRLNQALEKTKIIRPDLLTNKTVVQQKKKLH